MYILLLENPRTSMNLLFGVPMSCIKIWIKKKRVNDKKLFSIFLVYSPYYTSFLIVVIDDIIFVISEQQIQF